MKEGGPIQVPPDDTSALLVWIKDVARQARLAWRLFWDQRVPLWTKLIPPVALGYVLFPLDIIPDVVPGLGQLDDVAVLLIGVKLFIELSPPDVVHEHLRALGARIKEWRAVEDEEGESSVVIEGEYELKGPETPEG
ncbi:MAG TPA: YkvA family protein [Anaerolineae bacterium]|nr:YkvA family protein [Anaerolineae bacterium]